MRTCKYCNKSTSTAFYLQIEKAWACVSCYAERIINPKLAHTRELVA